VAEFGYKLSSEEHAAPDLVRYAARAEQAGFAYAILSDHFHPWVDRQGESPFAWTVLGGVAHATARIAVGTGVTCPTMRMHPALVAQASATVATLMPGRFFLGLGSGENLNEHIYGDRWPDVAERQAMLEEAIGVIRELWEGRATTHRGRYFTVVDARVYSKPPEPPRIVVAGSGRRAAELAGRVGDGFVGLAPDRSLLEAFDAAGGAGKPRYTEVHVCWDSDEGRARKTALEWWPNVATPGELVAELPLPRHFEQDAQRTSEDDVAASIACGPDPQAHVEAITPYLEAGYDHVSIHQVGPDQDGFFDFYATEVLPRLAS
jgi:coenzyme F420-dependent glucose-6-phosphate dehydrogenase